MSSMKRIQWKSACFCLLVCYDSLGILGFPFPGSVSKTEVLWTFHTAPCPPHFMVQNQHWINTCLNLPTQSAYRAIPTPNDYAMPPHTQNCLCNKLKSSLLNIFDIENIFLKKQVAQLATRLLILSHPLQPLATPCQRHCNKRATWHLQHLPHIQIFCLDQGAVIKDELRSTHKTELTPISPMIPEWVFRQTMKGLIHHGRKRPNALKHWNMLSWTCCDKNNQTFGRAWPCSIWTHRACSESLRARSKRYHRPGGKTTS